MAVVTDRQAAQYYNKQPKKRIGAGILLFNARDEVLIVKPNYLEKWLWIGGSVEDNESPRVAALRECNEEIGVAPLNIWLAFVNYLPALPTGQHEILQFLFTAEIVSDNFIDDVTLQQGEIEDIKFVPVGELDDYMHEYRARAIQTYLSSRASSKTLYLEDGYLL